jgi:hypothetical protein
MKGGSLQQIGYWVPFSYRKMEHCTGGREVRGKSDFRY